MEPLRHCLKTCKYHVLPHWNLVVWLNLVTAPDNEPTWNIFLSESVRKGAHKTACLLLWGPCYGSIWRIVCIISRILHCGLGGGEKLASRSDRLAPEGNYTVPIEELNILTAEPVWALLRRQNLLPFSGTEPRPVGRRARGQPLYHITHSPSRKIAYVYNSLCKIPVSWEAWRKQVFVWGLSLKNGTYSFSCRKPSDLIFISVQSWNHVLIPYAVPRLSRRAEEIPLPEYKFKTFLQPIWGLGFLRHT